MKRTTFLLTAILTLMACGQKQPPREELKDPIDTHQNVPGDSALYGLACDGSTDSILILLPLSGGDPDTFDIINARQEHRIYGRLQTGDEVAVMLNPEDKEEVLMVVNIERLRGKWCYQVTPTLRHADQMPERIQRRMLSRMPDSVKQTLLAPREFGFQLKRGYTAKSIGIRRGGNSDETSLVEFPRMKRYKDWRLFNGQLILTTDSILLPDGRRGLPEHDTADIIRLRHDTLVLKFKDHEQGYYRKN